MRPFAAVLLLAAPLLAEWGRDINAGMGPQLIESVRGDLAAIVAAAPADRAALIDAVIEKHGARRIEALKRFRNPELKPLFFALLDHDEWHVQHRALLALEYYGDTAVIDRALKLLTHPHRRLREKAAITCIKLWDGRPAPADWPRLLAAERDFHVRQCLHALELRMKGRLKLERVQKEVVRDGKQGLELTPFVSGLPAADRVPVEARTGGGKASPTTRWVGPLLGFDEEEVDGVNLQPFANLRQGGRVYHTGLDVGACLDGAGFYAAADGVVRLVHTGSDMGTLIVVQHATPDRKRVNAVYMHAGDTVFVAAGERVTAGQLLATMGLGFSIENGGHFAHLHYGLYPGAFGMAHNYGYKPVAAGLRDWYDPKRFLAHWIARTKPMIPDLRPLDTALRAAMEDMRASRYGEAHATARKVRDLAEPGGDKHVDAVYLLGHIENVPDEALLRVRALRKDGYPREALAQLKTMARACARLPGANKLAAERDAWEDDDLFAKALKGEGRLETATKRAARLKDRKKARALWQKLLEEFGDTCLKPRIAEALARSSQN